MDNSNGFITMNESINSETLKSIMSRNDNSLNEYFENAITFGLQQNLFKAFDNYLMLLINENNPQINLLFPRVLSLLSQFNELCSKSETNNTNINEDNNAFITQILTYFECFQLELGLKSITEFRDSVGIGNGIISSLYDSCANVLIKNCVKTVFEFVSTKENNSLDVIPFGQWVVANCSARIDLQGGWTDTPPICYELGGKVVNIAIKVNNRKPIGAKVRKVQLSHKNLITIKEYDQNKQLLVDLNLDTIQNLKDYQNPDSCGALVKAALICSGVVDINKTDENLYNQLETNLKSGLEIELWSDLPQGSGLGTSSILAGCLISAFWVLLGRNFSKTSLLHAVLYLEQLLTTGGGWQDQVGGIIGGVKLGTSLNSLPLKVDYKTVIMKPSFQSLFEKHLMLIYSGTVRLAKNLLQNVIHNWYIHEKKIIDCFNELRINADLCYEAFLNEDLESIGTLLSRYWQQKKILAPNSEPKHVSQFLIAVDPYIYGGSLCGAGGGGFMCLIIKDVSFRDQINLLVSQHLPDSQVYDCQIDDSGIEILLDNHKFNISDD